MLFIISIQKKDYVVSTWKECVALTKGYPHIFKSFPTTEEANAWLQSITPLMEEKGKNYPKEKVQKFYAVHYSDTEENFVETSWKKCQKRMEDREKCYTMYKSFLSPTDAFDWLDNIDMDKEERWFLIVKKDEQKNQKYCTRMSYQKKGLTIFDLMEKRPICIVMPSKKVQAAFIEWQKEKI